MGQIVFTNSDAANEFFKNKYPGYRLVHIQTLRDKTILHLQADALPICPRCGQPCPKVHNRTWREVRDIPLNHAGDCVILKFRIRRVRCRCGCYQCEKLSWLEPRARLANAMIGWLQALLRLRLPIQDVVRISRLSWDTVKTYDMLQLKYLFSQIDLSGVKHLMIDEFSVHRGYRYATVIMDCIERKVLWVCLGKSKKSVQPFFDRLITEGRANQIESVTCDMNAAFPAMARENLPRAKIIYDLFHVMRNFTKDVLVLAKNKSLQDCINEQKNSWNHSNKALGQSSP